MNSPDSQPSNCAVRKLDRRQHPRYTTQVQIEIRLEGSDVPMRLVTTDLSLGGCYIELMIPLSVGIRLQATLWLDGYSIVIRGLVVTRHPQFGNGIMFVEIEGHGEQLLHRYLDSITTYP
jgi:c-di-GMP-binding flagellar brake protein YcgR